MQVTVPGSSSSGLKAPHQRFLASQGSLRRSSSTPCLSSNAPAATSSSRLRDDACHRASSRHASECGAALENRCVAQDSSTAAPTPEAVAAQHSGASIYMAQGAFASLTRVLLIGQPTNLFRNLAQRKWKVAGPISLLLFLLGLIVAVFAAVRIALVKRVKACKCCKGYGIVRCRLCDGDGKVGWSAKFSYQEVCPLCMTKRHVTCPDCGGHYHRKMFSHAKLVKLPTDGFAFKEKPSMG